MKIHDVEKLTHYPHLNLFKIRYVDMAFQEKQWLVASRGEKLKIETRDFSLPDAVVIVPFHEEENKLAVIREYRVALGGFQYGFPAGLLDPGETVEDTARRELKEETGLEITRFLHASPPIYSSSGLTDESVAMVYAQCQGRPTNAHNESSEDIQVIFVSAQTASELCRDASVMCDVKTWLVLHTYGITGALQW